MMYTFRPYRLLAAFFGLLLLASGALPAMAQQSAGAQTKQEIRTMLEERDQQIKSILKQKEGDDGYSADQREKLKTLINGVIDFRAMSRTALGPHWDGLSDEQRTEFVDVFRDVVRAQSLSDLGVYNSRVTFDEIAVAGDSAFVQTTTEYKGTQTPVEYVLERQNDGQWLAEDIIVDDASTAQSYANSFQPIVNQHGFDALLKSLKKRRDRTQS